SAHPLASVAGAEILAAGGNAFDAAVAVAAALGVVEPFSSGLGGGGFFLLHRSADRRDQLVDARETAPGAAAADMFLGTNGEPVPRASLDGPRAAAIPGTPAGLAWLAENYGRLPLEQSLAPAIRLAREGFPVDERFARVSGIAAQKLAADPQARRVFLADGAPMAAGTRLRQPQLADTLAALARSGRSGFYQGPIAEELVRSVRASGGIWTAEDLAGYRVLEREPVRIRYGGATIVTAGLPSAGGLTLAQAFNALAQFDLPRLSEAERTHVIVEVLRRAYRDRARYLGDPDFVDGPWAKLADPAYAAAQAATIRLDRATPSAGLASGPEGENTTHFSIVDREGNRVAATLTINTLFGSGFVAGATGVLLNNEMDDFAVAPGFPNAYGLVGSRANAIAPGKRPLSSMSPTFVEDRRGVLVLGTPGGSRIISMVLLAVLDYLGQEKPDLAAIVAAPRYHHQYLPDRIEVEPEGFSERWRAALAAKGHVVTVAARRWGNMQAVHVDGATGAATAASDPRGEGGVAWY
ncbi:MAG TPA: gamma-glutamyltransferase, partial [Pelomicrobium sp.]|nr:gamma-glutamyltransferase [Pelomicrobium sp.]